MRTIVLPALAALLLTACVPQSFLEDRAVQENVTTEDVLDTILVANILRARDQAPLHFADVPLIHESLQATSGITPTLIFGPVHAGTGSDSVAPTISVQEAPTFDLNNLDTQEFITGVMSPIKPRVVKYWLDRGLDDRIALLLFFSSVTVSVGEGQNAESLTVFNNPRGAMGPGASSQGFRAYLSIINSINGRFKVVEAPDITPVGPPFSVDPARRLSALSSIDTDKYEVDPLEPNPDTAKRSTQQYTIVEDPVPGKAYDRYQLFSVSDKKLVICFDSKRSSALSAADRKACKDAGFAPNKPGGESQDPCKHETETSAKGGVPFAPCPHPEDFAASSCSATLKFALRSAGDVIHFLGDLVWLQENMNPRNLLNNPITLGPPGACQDGILFDIPPDGTGPDRGRLLVPYRGIRYVVPNATLTDSNHTLQVLAMTAALINLYKSATELRSTPTVQVVP